MITLDYRSRIPGYYDSIWPVECGGPRRQKLVAGSGLNCDPGEQFSSTSRNTGGWAVMLIRRGEGELFLLCGASVNGKIPPIDLSKQSDQDFSKGWVERLDPTTLEPVATSTKLSSGGFLWCGGLLAHENGDLYLINGNYCYRLSSDLANIKAEVRLPVNAPYNGLLVFQDGNLITKNLGHASENICLFSVLSADDLSPIAESIEVSEPCMGRFSIDRISSEEEHVYFTTETTLHRLIYSVKSKTLKLDMDWSRNYQEPYLQKDSPGKVGMGQTGAWDSSIGGEWICIMDKGRPPPWRDWPSEENLGVSPQRLFIFSKSDRQKRIVLSSINKAYAWNPGPPLYDPERSIFVYYDSVSGIIEAHYFDQESFKCEFLWRHEFRNTIQMMLFASTGELVVEDAPNALTLGSVEEEHKTGRVVVLQIESGLILGSAPTHMRSSSGMFLCPGFQRDFYVASIEGVVTRVFLP